MRRILDWVMGVAEALGGPGLFFLSFLDSSFLSFPEVVDVLMVGLVARYPERMLWYAFLPTLGSVSGCYALYAFARRGGEAFVRRRLHERHVDRAFAIFRKYGMLAIAIPSIMPPPVPFKIFVLAAGAAGMRKRDFLIAVSVGRGLRFFAEAILAAWYGPVALTRITAFVQQHKWGVILALLMLMVIGGIWIWWRRGPVDSDPGKPL
ncbi:MAG TPA: VTT domain-containing protein [Vicinamibacterales bacterium]|nr:VTT domain-containing protein [Vicinamibacterales bacterium]